MKRLISPANNGGLPYVNSDFNDILQMEHIKSYAAYLDGINDIQTGSNANRGIVVKGVDVVATTLTTTTLDLTDSLVYIPGATGPGDFYEAHPSIATTNYQTTNYFFIQVDPNPTTENRVFRSGASLGVIEKKYFTITTGSPSGNYIEFLNGGTKRRYSRILKYATTAFGDVMITSNVNNFIGSVGVNDMHGFRLADGQQGTVDLRNRFIVGYDYSKQSTPADNTTTITNGLKTYDSTDISNYGTIGNIGGGVKVDGTLNPSARLDMNQIPTHNHGGNTGTPNADLNHNHGPAAQNFAMADNLTSSGSNNSSRSSLENNRSTQPRTGYIADTTSGIGPTLTHTHTIQNQGGGLNAEIRPPYMVLAYYQKIAV